MTLRGQQRLLSFEIGRTGRFGLFHGDASGDVLHTVQALETLVAADRIEPVDPAALERIRGAILDERAADGSWYGDPARTALATRVLADAGATPADLAPSRRWLADRLEAMSGNPYPLSLTLLALGPGHARFAERLPGLVADAEDRAGSTTLMGGRGRAGRSETTALAVLAMLEQGVEPGSLRSGLEASRRAGGTWGSTAATALAIRALVAAHASGLGRTGRLDVRIGDRHAGRLTWDAETADLHESLDLTEFLSAGARRIELETDPGFTVQVQIALTYHVAVTARDLRGLDVRLDLPVPARLAIGEDLRGTIRVTNAGARPTSMLVVQIPASSLLAVASVAGARLREDFPDRTDLYLDALGPGESHEIELRLRAIRPGVGAGPGVVAYDYYDPDRRDWAETGTVRVAPR